MTPKEKELPAATNKSEWTYSFVFFFLRRQIKYKKISICFYEDGLKVKKSTTALLAVFKI